MRSYQCHLTKSWVPYKKSFFLLTLSPPPSPAIGNSNSLCISFCNLFSSCLYFNHVESHIYTYACTYIYGACLYFGKMGSLCILVSKSNFSHLTVHHGNLSKSTGIDLARSFEWLHNRPLCGYYTIYYPTTSILLGIHIVSPFFS